jgi:hypothetical protein
VDSFERRLDGILELIAQAGGVLRQPAGEPLESLALRMSMSRRDFSLAANVLQDRGLIEIEREPSASGWGEIRAVRLRSVLDE